MKATAVDSEAQLSSMARPYLQCSTKPIPGAGALRFAWGLWTWGLGTVHVESRHRLRRPHLPASLGQPVL